MRRPSNKSGTIPFHHPRAFKRLRKHRLPVLFDLALLTSAWPSHLLCHDVEDQAIELAFPRNRLGVKGDAIDAPDLRDLLRPWALIWFPMAELIHWECLVRFDLLHQVHRCVGGFQHQLRGLFLGNLPRWDLIDPQRTIRSWGGPRDE